MSAQLITRRQAIVVCAAGVGFSGAAPAQPALQMKVYRNPGCGCCEQWVEKLKAEGFAATIEDRDDLAEMKQRLGVPDDLTSCHTGLIAGYVIEGHVPAREVRRLLSERPAALGLSVPGMPVGSPGMEEDDGTTELYFVWLFQKNGKRKQFAQYP